MDMHDNPACCTTRWRSCRRLPAPGAAVRGLNLLSLNNDETYHSSGGVGYTTSCPGRTAIRNRIRPRDMWASAESQELDGVSREHARRVRPAVREAAARAVRPDRLWLLRPAGRQAGRRDDASPTCGASPSRRSPTWSNAPGNWPGRTSSPGSRTPRTWSASSTPAMSGATSRRALDAARPRLRGGDDPEGHPHVRRTRRAVHALDGHSARSGRAGLTRVSIGRGGSRGSRAGATCARAADFRTGRRTCRYRPIRSARRRCRPAATPAGSPAGGQARPGPGLPAAAGSRWAFPRRRLCLRRARTSTSGRGCSRRSPATATCLPELLRNQFT